MRASPLTDLLPQDPLTTGKALARVSQAPGFASPELVWGLAPETFAEWTSEWETLSVRV